MPIRTTALAAFLLPFAPAALVAQAPPNPDALVYPSPTGKQAETDEYTRYELLAPESASFKIHYEVTAITEGAKVFYNPIRKGSVASDEAVFDAMTGQPLHFEVVSGADARRDPLLPDADPATDYIKVTLARPVPHAGQARLLIVKTYKDAKSYHTDGDAIVFDRPLGVPRDQVVFKDGWHVMGLEGTGSYDYHVIDRFVPDAYTFALMGPPRRGGPLYRLRVPVIGTAGHAGWALGTARRALDEALSASGRPFMRGLTPVGQMEGYLTELGELDAALRSARSYVLDVFAEAEAFIEHAEALSGELSARVQQAITQCTRVAVDVVRKSFEWSGVSAIRNGVLERAFRDVHVAAQHVTQTRASFANVTRVAVAG